MKEIKVDILDKDSIELICISDTHIGSKQFNEGLLKETIKYIIDNDCYVILNGDIIDNCLPSSVGDAFDNQMTPSQALAKACEMFEPIKDKILCSTSGNHEDRSKKLTDITPSMALAVHLGIEKHFSFDSILLYLNMKLKGRNGKTTFVIFVNHGRNGNGRNSGSKANALESMSLLIPSCDIYIHSHTHSPMTFKDEFYQVDRHKRRGYWCERLYVNTNAFLDYFNSYGEMKLFKASSQSIPKIRLNIARKTTKNSDRIIKTISCEI